MKTDILLGVDMQDDFIHGSLTVPNGMEVIIPANRLLRQGTKSILTKDWHPKNHSSFASVHRLKSFDMKDGRVLWPDHCVAGTWGAKLHIGLDLSNVVAIIHKGMDANVESFSGFYDERGYSSILTPILESMNIERVFVFGLALDYCVKATALDAVRDQFETFIVKDATRSVDPNFEWTDPSVRVISTDEALETLAEKTP